MLSIEFLPHRLFWIGSLPKRTGNRRVCLYTTTVHVEFLFVQRAGKSFVPLFGKPFLQYDKKKQPGFRPGE